MNWIDIKTEKPEEYVSVLVASNLFGDDDRHFFVADYCYREKEWIIHEHYQPKNSPYIRISKKILKNDQWTYIEWPNE